MNKQMIREIREGKNLEQNLPVFLNEMASVNQAYAGISFAIQYYNYYEAVVDQDLKLPEELAGLLGSISRMVKENFLAFFGNSSFDAEAREASIKELDEARKLITAKMKVLTTYTDLFGLYEYVLNRIEPQFETVLANMDDDTIAREILQYIFMEKDNVVINDKIHQMLSQLPVRMSRGKFCDLVRSGMEPYLESDCSLVEDFIYRVESTAGLYRPEGFEEYFPEIFSCYQEMAANDWKSMDEESYRHNADVLEQAVGQIVSATDAYYGMMEVVNFLYAWLLNYPYAAAGDLQQTEHMLGLVRAISENIENKKWENIPEELVKEFEKAEGVLEDYSLTMQKHQGLLEEVKENVEREMEALVLDQLFHCLRLSSLLLSGSLFVDLDKAAASEKVTREFLNQRGEELCQKLMDALSTQPKPLNRAMIAAVLHELPVFFNSHNEVMDYVRGSLAGCRDLAEKTASVRLMKELMEE